MENKKAEEFSFSSLNFQNIQRICTNFEEEYRPESHSSISSLIKDKNSDNQGAHLNPNVGESINSKFLLKSNDEAFNYLISLNDEKVDNSIKLPPNSNEKNPDVADFKSIENQKFLKESKTKFNKEDLKEDLKGDKTRGSKTKRFKKKFKNGKGNKNGHKCNYISKKRNRDLSKQLFFVVHIEVNNCRKK